MANQSGIIIDIGFTSDIKRYVDKIESEFKRINFQEKVGLSDALKKEYEQINEYIKKIRAEFSNFTEGTDIEKLSKSLTEVTDLSKKLSSAFVKMSSVFSAEDLSKLGLTDFIEQLKKDAKDITNETESINEAIKITADTAVEKVKLANKALENLYNEYGKRKRRRDKMLAFEDSDNNWGGLGKDRKSEMIVLNRLAESWETAAKARETYYELTGDEKDGGEQLDVFADNIQKALGAAKAFAKFFEKNSNIKYPQLKIEGNVVSVNELLKEIERGFEEAKGLLGEEMESLNKIGKSQYGTDIASNFVKKTRKANNAIEVPIVLTPGSRDNLADSVKGVVNSINKMLESNPITVEINFSNSYQSKKNQKGINDIKSRMEDFYQKAADATSEEEAAKVKDVADRLNDLVTQMTAQIDNATTFTIKVASDTAFEKIQEFVKNAKEELADLQKVASNPESLKLLNGLLGKVKEISDGLKEMSAPLKVLIDDSFPEHITARTEALDKLYQQLVVINPMLKTFAQAIGKLDDEKVQRNLVAMTTRAAEVIREATELINPVLPEGRAGDIELTIKNKDEILKEIAQVELAVKNIFNPELIDMWEQRFLDALETIKTECGYIFDASADKNTISLLSAFVDELTIGDQISRMTQGPYYNTPEGMFSAVFDTLEQFHKEVESLDKDKEKLLAEKQSLEKDNTDKNNASTINAIDEKIKGIDNRLNEIKTAFSEKFTFDDDRFFPTINREHGGILTTDGRVIGISNVDRATATDKTNVEYYEKLLGISIKEILSTIHSHAGEIAWNPSSDDLIKLISSGIPNAITVAEKEIAVANRQVFIDFLQKNSLLKMNGKEIDAQKSVDGLINLAEDYLAKHDFENDAEYKAFIEPFNKYIEELRAKSVDNEDPERVYKERWALERVFSENFKTSIRDVFQIMSHEEFAKNPPFGLSAPNSGTVNLLRDALERAIGKTTGNTECCDHLIEINNGVKEIINILTNHPPILGGGGGVRTTYPSGVDAAKKELEQVRNEINFLKNGGKSDARDNKRNDKKVNKRYVVQQTRTIPGTAIAFATGDNINGEQQAEYVESIVKHRKQLDTLLNKLKSQDISKFTSEQIGEFDGEYMELHKSFHNWTDNFRGTAAIFKDVKSELAPLREVRSLIESWFDWKLGGQGQENVQQTVDTFLQSVEMIKGSKVYDAIGDEADKLVQEYCDRIRAGKIDAEKAFKEFAGVGEAALAAQQSVPNSLRTVEDFANLRKVLNKTEDLKDIPIIDNEKISQITSTEEYMTLYEILLKINNEIYNFINNKEKSISLTEDEVNLLRSYVQSLPDIYKLEDESALNGWIRSDKTGKWVDLINEQELTLNPPKELLNKFLRNNESFSSEFYKMVFGEMQTAPDVKAIEDAKSKTENFTKQTADAEEKLAKARTETAKATEQATWVEQSKPQSELDQKLDILRKQISEKSFNLRTTEGKQNLDTYAQQIIKARAASNGEKSLDDILAATVSDKKIREKLNVRIAQIMLASVEQLNNQLTQEPEQPSIEEVVNEAQLEEFDATVTRDLSWRSAEIIEQILKDPKGVLELINSGLSPKFALWSKKEVAEFTDFMNSDAFKNVEGSAKMKKAFDSSIKHAMEIRDKALIKVFDGQAIGDAFTGLLNIIDSPIRIDDELDSEKAKINQEKEKANRAVAKTLMGLREEFQKNPTNEDILSEIVRVTKESNLPGNVKSGIYSYLFGRSSSSDRKLAGIQNEFKKKDWGEAFRSESKNAQYVVEARKLINSFIERPQVELLKQLQALTKKSTSNSYLNKYFDKIVSDVSKALTNSGGKKYGKYELLNAEINRMLSEEKNPPAEPKLKKVKQVRVNKSTFEKWYKFLDGTEFAAHNANIAFENKMLEGKDEKRKTGNKYTYLKKNGQIGYSIPLVVDEESWAVFQEQLKEEAERRKAKAALKVKVELEPEVSEAERDTFANRIKKEFDSKLLSDNSKNYLDYIANSKNNKNKDVAKEILATYDKFAENPDLMTVAHVHNLVEKSQLPNNQKQHIIEYLTELAERAKGAASAVNEVAEAEAKVEAEGAAATENKDAEKPLTKAQQTAAKLAALEAREKELENYIQAYEKSEAAATSFTTKKVDKSAQQSATPLTQEVNATNNVATSMEDAAKNKEAFATANEKVAKSAEKSASKITAEVNALTGFTDSISKLPQKKNPILTQLENIVKNADAIKAASESLKAGKNPLTPKKTKEDAMNLLAQNEANIRTAANSFVANRLGILSPEQIEAESKSAQATLNKVWSEYNIADELMKSGAMEESVAKEYAQAFVDSYMNAVSKGFQVNLTGEQQSFLEPFKELIPSASSNNSKFIITEMKAMADGLVHITALAKDANGEYQKLLLTYNQGSKTPFAIEKIETDSASAKAAMSELGEETEKVTVRLGHVKRGTDEWNRLVDKLSELNIGLQDVDQIIRQVDRDGSESFRVFDSLGNVKTVGIDSQGFLFEKEFVAQSRTYLVTEFEKISNTISNILNGAYKGDENASIKLVNALTRMKEIYEELQSFQGNISDEKMAELPQRLSNEFVSAIDALDKINLKKMPVEFKTALEALKAGLQSLSQIAADGNFETVINNIGRLAQESNNLGNSQRNLQGNTVDNLKKILANTAEDRNKNTSMPRQMRKEYDALIEDMKRAIELSKDGIIPIDTFDQLKSRSIDLRARLKELGIEGKSMGDKISRSLKNSLISVARMYLSWYRWIAYIRQGVQEVTNLDTALTKMSYTMNVTDAQLSNMSKQMVSMAKDLSTSVENISQIYQIYANLQTTQEELEKTARPTAILANLSGVDAATAADQLQGVLNQFSLAADDAEHIVDVYDKISASIKVDYSKGIAGMADAVKNVGNFASEAGMSFEQLAAIVGRVMQQTRQEGGQIGVALKTIMTRISRANKLAEDGEVDNKTLSQASAALKRFANIDVYTPAGEFREFDVIMTELAAKWDQLSDAEQKNISFAIAATRQSATLSAVLSNWSSAMDLATDAVNTNGNALANNQKYIDSIAGKTQALKTELNDLWITLFETDNIKDLIDSVKDMVISLKSGVTGLKPVIDLLTYLLKLISQIISVVPTGGLIASILGLKFGSKLSLKDIKTKFAEIAVSVGSLTSATTASAAATNLLTKAWGALGAAFKANPIGFVLTAVTIGWTVVDALIENLDEAKQKYDELAAETSKAAMKLNSINEQLETQKRIIDDLSSKRLSYVEKKDLANAKELTAELERQKLIAEQTYRTSAKESGEQQVKVWQKEGYNLDSVKSAQFALENLSMSSNEITGLSKDFPAIVSYYLGIAKYSEDVTKDLKDVNAYLQNTDNKEYYEYLKNVDRTLDSAEQRWLEYYEFLQALEDKAFKAKNHDTYNRQQVDKLFNDEDLENLLIEFESRVGQNIYRKDIFSQILREDMFKPLFDAVTNMDVAWEDVDNPLDLFWNKFVERFEMKEEEAKKEVSPIDLATWYADPSSIDSEKTWKEILDSYESGLNSLGDLLDKWQSGNEVIDLKDIFDVTDVTDSIFQQFGMSPFQEYLKRAGGDEEQALISYIRSSYNALMKNIDDPELIENFDIVTEKLQKLINVAGGGANDIQKLGESYKELKELHEAIANGETLSTQRAAELIDKYDALQDAVKIVGDEYTFEEDAIISLINQYIELQNTSVSAQIVMTKIVIENAMKRITAFRLERQEAVRMLEMYDGITKAGGLNETDAVGIIAKSFNRSTSEIMAIINTARNLIESEGSLKQLEELLASVVGDKDKYNSDSTNEIDWIANSIENLTRVVDEAQSAYDRLLSTTGSKKALKTANDYLTKVNDALETQAKGFDKAAVSYKKELDALGLSSAQLERVRNVALGNESAWTIQEFAGDSKEYDRLNKALDFYKKYMDELENARQARHTIAENEIQILQNEADYYGNLIAKYEAMITPETSIKKQQKYVTKLIDLYKKQYDEEMAIAKLKGDEIELLKLQAEWEQKNNELIVQRRQISIDDITTRYERILSEFENRQSILEHGIAMTEAKGSLVSTKYYEALIDNERDSVDKLLAERKRLVGELEKIDTSSKEGLDQWWETKDAIDAVTQSLYESEEAMREWANAIRQVKWDLFDRITDSVHNVADEADYLIDLLSRDDAFESVKELWSNDGTQTKVYYGQWSKEGLATLGLYEVQIKTNKELAEDYAEEIKSLNKEIKEHPTDLNLIDRRNELIERQREAIQAIEDEKQAILDLVRDGYDKQLSSLETLSSKYMEALQAEKDLYDYQKNIKKQTKDIVNLRRQMAAYANDTSEEARGKIQRLTVELQEAEENLQDTQYDRYLQDQQSILDRMYNEFETFVDNKMDEREKLLKEMSAKVDANQKSIKSTITNKTTELGSTLSQTMKNVLKEKLDGGRTIEEVISAKDIDIAAIAASTKNTDEILQNYIDNYDKEGGMRTTINAISSKIDNINTNLISIAEQLGLKVDKTDTSGDKGEYKSSGSMMSPVISTTPYVATSTANKVTVRALKPGEGYMGVVASDFYQNGKYGNYRIGDPRSAKKIYDTMTVKEGTGVLLKNDSRYGEFDINNPEKFYKYMYQWLKRNGYYASGSRRIGKSQYAWTQEKGLEAIVRPSDGAILTPLARGDSVLNAGATQNIWDMANNPMQFIKDNLSFPINLPSVMPSGNYDIQQNMSITLPNVMNYPEFVTALQNDKRFEKMMQDMTVNQLTKPNALAKFKYKY